MQLGVIEGDPFGGREGWGPAVTFFLPLGGGVLAGGLFVGGPGPPVPAISGRFFGGFRGVRAGIEQTYF